ncbi:MAG: nickel/cobalt transporter [Fibrobacterota bacterium]
MPEIFIETLRSLDGLINSLVHQSFDTPGVSIIAALIFFSFLYGLVHSAGPGHGKALVLSFFLKEKYPLKKSVFLAGIISIIHNGSAVILSFLFAFIFTGIKGMMHIKIQGYFMLMSGILITLTGIIFLIIKLRSRKKRKQGREAGFENGRGILLTGFSAGLVPCPVAIMIMMLAISKGNVMLGLLVVASISTGMFFLLSVIGAFSIKARDGMLSFSEKKLKNSERIAEFIQYASIAVIIFIGSAIWLTYLF